MLEHFLDKASKILLVCAALIGFCLSFIVVADVAGRVLFNRPLKGTPEIVSAAIVIICWLQAAYAIRSGGMLHVDAFTTHMPVRWQAVLGAIGSLLGVFLFGLICYGSLDQAAFAWASGEYEGEGALRVPSWPARFTLVLGSALAALSYLLLAIKQIDALRKGEAPVVAGSSH